MTTIAIIGSGVAGLTLAARLGQLYGVEYAIFGDPRAPSVVPPCFVVQPAPGRAIKPHSWQSRAWRAFGELAKGVSAEVVQARRVWRPLYDGATNLRFSKSVGKDLDFARQISLKLGESETPCDGEGLRGLISYGPAWVGDGPRWLSHLKTVANTTSLRGQFGKVASVSPQGERWHLVTTDGQDFEADWVVVAVGGELPRSFFKFDDELSVGTLWQQPGNDPQPMIVDGGHLVSFGGQRTLGASFASVQASDATHDAFFAQLTGRLSRSTSLSFAKPWQTWRGHRVTQRHIRSPLIGRLGGHRLWVTGALGASGFGAAALGADYFCRHLAGEQTPPTVSLPLAQDGCLCEL